jgi:hypothetical protein
MNEGQTSTADWERMADAVRDHRKAKAENPPPPSTIQQVTAGLAAFIETMEEEPGEEVPQEPRKVFQSILVGNGWPERFVVESGEPRGGEWKAAYAMACPVIESGGIAVFHGTRGTGKSRMAAEIAKNVRFPADQTRGKKLTGAPKEIRRTSVYRTAMKFFTEIRATYRKDSARSEAEVIEALTEPGLLVIDELQERGETAFEDRLLTHLIDARYGAMLPTILICNLTKEQLFESINPSIADRIAENGKRIEFNWSSYRRA